MASNRRRATLVAALALFGTAPPVVAEPDPSRSIAPQVALSLEALAAKDLRVATVAYRLQTAALPLCTHRIGLPGLIVQDASQYREDLRPAMGALFNLTDLPAVTGVVPGGPAAAAGLHAGDQLVAMNGVSLAAIPARRTRRANGSRFTAIANRLADAFARGPVTLTLRRDGVTMVRRITGTPGCASLVQLDLAATRNAGADGHTVTVSQGLLDFLGDDDELAVVLGHELAHDILGHREYLGRTGTGDGLFAGIGANGKRIRETEREADYYGLYLDAWAGYDVDAAVPFWQRMARAGWLQTLIGDGTHPGFSQRIADLGREAAIIHAQQAGARPVRPDYAAFKAGRE